MHADQAHTLSTHTSGFYIMSCACPPITPLCPAPPPPLCGLFPFPPPLLLVQVNHREEWLQCLRSTFDAMDVDKDGRLRPSEILEALKDKLPEAEVRQPHWTALDHYFDQVQPINWMDWQGIYCQRPHGSMGCSTARAVLGRNSSFLGSCRLSAQAVGSFGYQDCNVCLSYLATGVV